MDFKYITVIHPAGAGGNHISNLISLCPGMAPRALCSDNEEYVSHIYRVLNKSSGIGVTTHDSHGTFKSIKPLTQNLQESFLHSNIELIKNMKSKFIFNSHALEFIYSVYFHSLDLTPMKCLIVKYPDNNCLQKRIEIGPWKKGNPANDPGQYTIEWLKDKTYDNPLCHYKVSENNSFVLDMDRCMEVGGYHYIQEVLYKECNLVLHDKYDKFHTSFIDFIHRTFG